MYEVKKLSEERATLVTKVQDMGRVLKTENREIRSDEKDSMEKMLDQIEVFDDKIEKAKTLQRADEVTNEIRSTNEKRSEKRLNTFGSRDDVKNAVKAWILKDYSAPQRDEYRNAAQRVGFDWTSATMDLPVGFSYSAWEQQGREQRSTQSGMSVGSIPNILGGDFVVPTILSKMCDVQLRMYCKYRDISRVFPTETGNNSLMWLQLTDIQSNAAVDHTENTDDLEADATLGQISIPSTMRGSSVLPISIELLRDSVIELLPLLAEALTRRIGKLEASEFTTTLTGTSGIGSSTTATQGVITYQDVQTALWKADFAYQEEEGYGVMCSQDFARYTLSWIDTDNRPLWQMNTADIGRGFKTFLGYPVVINNALSAVGNGNTVAVIGSFAQRSVVRQVGTLQVQVLNEVLMRQLAKGIISWCQAGFALTRPEAFTKLVVHA